MASAYTDAIFDAAVATRLVQQGTHCVSNVHYDKDTGDVTWFDEDRGMHMNSSIMSTVDPHMYAELRDAMKVMYAAVNMKLIHVDSVIHKTENTSVSLQLDGTMGNPAIEIFQCASHMEKDVLDRIRSEVSKYLTPDEMKQVDFIFQSGDGAYLPPSCCVM